jgi:hypothetical protein
MFSPLSIILDRDAKIVYDHPCMEEALEGILCRIRPIILSGLQGLFCLWEIPRIKLAIFYITRLDDCE